MTSPRRPRILIADDSALFVEVLSDILQQDGTLEVVGVARDGEAAVRLAASLAPDLVVMDVHMPVMNGLEAIERIMSTNPVPILVMTAEPSGATGALGFEALSRGALELVEKPGHWTDPRVGAELRARVHGLVTVPVIRHMRPRELWTLRPPSPAARAPQRQRRQEPRSSAPRVLAIGASTGGPVSLAQLLSALPRPFPAGILLVQHLGEGFVQRFATWLEGVTGIRCVVVEAETDIVVGRVHIAGDGAHLEVNGRGRCTPGRTAPRGGHRPSVDVLFESVAAVFGPSAVGALLSGMGADGAHGLLRMRRAGASTFGQSEASCAVYGMPKAAWDLGAVGRQLDPGPMAAAIASMFGAAAQASGRRA